MAESHGEPAFDTLLAGRLKLAQPPSGHRAGTEAVLLAAVTPPGFDGSIVDLGASTGAVGLMAGLRAPGARLVLVEIDPAMAALARINAEANGMAGRCTVVEADVRASHRERTALGLTADDAALVLCNPPWLAPERSRVSPDDGRRRAHMLPDGDLDLWTKAAADMLAARGMLALIHRAEALEECLRSLSVRFGGIRALPVHPRADAPASRILVSAVKGSRAALALLPPLVLHEEDGAFTPLAAAIHRGEAGLDLQLRGAAQRAATGSP